MLATKHSRVSIILVCFVLGFMLAVQFHSTQNTLKYSTQYQRVEELSQQLLQIRHERDVLKQQYKAQLKSPDKLSSAALIEAGISAVEGPGVVLTIVDSDKKALANDNVNLYVVHDEDMLRIINELRAAGAEAIAINGQRVVATTEIRCAGPTISVNNERSAPPFQIKAIGNTETMENALKMRGGVIETLGVWGIKINVSTEKNINIPAYNRVNNFKYAVPVEKGSNK